MPAIRFGDGEQKKKVVIPENYVVEAKKKGRPENYVVQAK